MHIFLQITITKESKKRNKDIYKNPALMPVELTDFCDEVRCTNIVTRTIPKIE